MPKHPVWRLCWCLPVVLCLSECTATAVIGAPAPEEVAKQVTEASKSYALRLMQGYNASLARRVTRVKKGEAMRDVRVVGLVAFGKEGRAKYEHKQWDALAGGDAGAEKDVFAINPRYGFKLKSRGGTPLSVMSIEDKETRPRSLTAAEALIAEPYTVGNCHLPTMFESGVAKVTKVTAAGEATCEAHIVFRDHSGADNVAGGRCYLVHANVMFRSDGSWVIDSFSGSQRDGRSRYERVSGKNEYIMENGVPLLVRQEKVLDSPTTSQVDDDVTKWVDELINPTTKRLPDEQFLLSHYGFGEPGLAPEESTPLRWLLVGNVVVIALLLCGMVVRRARRGGGD